MPGWCVVASSASEISISEPFRFTSPRQLEPDHAPVAPPRRSALGRVGAFQKRRSSPGGKICFTIDVDSAAAGF